jgi:hypothetical protein
MPQLFDPKTFSYEQLAQLNNVPGQSLGQTNTPQQLTNAGAMGYGGSLQGTMTGQGSQQGQPVVIPPQIQQQSSPMALFQAMNAMQSQTKANNVLMTQRNLLLKQLYDTPLTSEELNQLDPTMKQAVQSNNRDHMDISLRLISDQVQGRTQTIDSSMQFLTNQYMDSIEKAEAQKQQSLESVLSYSKALGAKPSEVASALGYGGTYDWSALDNMMVSAPKTNLPAIGEEYEYAKKEGYKGSLMDYQKLKATQYGTENVPGQKDIFGNAENTILQYKNAGISRASIEKQYADAGKAIPLEVQTALDKLYPVANAPTETKKRTWNPLTWF